VLSGQTTGDVPVKTSTPSQGTIKVLQKTQTAETKPTSPPTPKASQQPTTTPLATSKPSVHGYDVSIAVVKDGKPVVGATVELHSIPRKTTTDKAGIARFSDVEAGDHTVKLAYNGYNGEEKITLSGEKRDVAINLNVDLKPNNTFFSLSSKIVIILMSCIILSLVFILVKKQRAQHRNF
jgi:hypothetical protein